MLLARRDDGVAIRPSGGEAEASQENGMENKHGPDQHEHSTALLKGRY